MTKTDRHPSPAASHAETAGARTIAAALTSGLVSFHEPDGLILSTGNLYLTSHPSGNFSSAIGSDALGPSVTSASNVFWGDAVGVHRQVF